MKEDKITMKEKYLTPEMDIELLHSEIVVTISTDLEDGGGDDSYEDDF